MAKSKVQGRRSVAHDLAPPKRRFRPRRQRTNQSRTSAAIEAELAERIRRARQGDADAALSLMQAFISAVKDASGAWDHKAPFRKRLAWYFVGCFDAILSQRVDANTALHLNRERHRPKGSHQTNHHSLADRVAERLVGSLKTSTHDGKMDPLFEIVAGESGVSKNTVKAAWKRLGFISLAKLSDGEEWPVAVSRSRDLLPTMGAVRRRRVR